MKEFAPSKLDEGRKVLELLLAKHDDNLVQNSLRKVLRPTKGHAKHEADLMLMPCRSYLEDWITQICEEMQIPCSSSNLTMLTQHMRGIF